jgi:hypothetical protein
VRRREWDPLDVPTCLRVAKPSPIAARYLLELTREDAWLWRILTQELVWR